MKLKTTLTEGGGHVDEDDGEGEAIPERWLMPPRNTG